MYLGAQATEANSTQPSEHFFYSNVKQTSWGVCTQSNKASLRLGAPVPASDDGSFLVLCISLAPYSEVMLRVTTLIRAQDLEFQGGFSPLNILDYYSVVLKHLEWEFLGSALCNYINE